MSSAIKTASSTLANGSIRSALTDRGTASTLGRQETTMASYDPNNVFAKILRGELPCHKVYEDDRAFAFLDIMPRAPGHTLVIPKAPARNILDVDPDDLAHLAIVSQKVAKAGMKVFKADGVTMQQFSEPAGGQVVFHLHVHIIPRQDGVALKPPASFKEEPAVLSDQALRLATALREA
jgi:histidine triad (HIT) family protein